MAQTPASDQNKARLKLLDDLAAIAAGHINDQFSSCIPNITGALQEASADPRVGAIASDHLQANAYAFAYGVADKARARLRKETRALMPRKKKVATPGMLSLIPMEEMDSKLVFDTVGRPFEARYSDDLATLNVRLGNALGRDILRTPQNPFRPDVLLGAIYDAWCEFAPDEAMQALLMPLLKPDVLFDFKPMYQDLAAELQRNRKEQVQAEPAADDAARAAQLAAQEAERAKVEAELNERLRVLLGGTLKAAPEPEPEPAPAAPAPAMPLEVPMIPDIGTIKVGGHAWAPAPGAPAPGGQAQGILAPGVEAPAGAASGMQATPQQAPAQRVSPFGDGDSGAVQGGSTPAEPGGAPFPALAEAGFVPAFVPAAPFAGVTAGEGASAGAPAATVAIEGGPAAGATTVAAAPDVSAIPVAGTTAGAPAAGTPAAAGAYAGMAGAATVQPPPAPLALLDYLRGVALPAFAIAGQVPGATLQPAPGGVGAPVGTPALPTNLAGLKQSLPPGALSPADENTINLLVQVFEAAVRFPGVAEPVRDLIDTLQIPVLKSALQDKAFFFEEGHPARRLLDLMSAVAWEVRPTQEDPLMQAMQRNVERVERNVDREPGVFAEAVADLETAIRHEEVVAEETMAAPVAAALRHEKIALSVKAARAAIKLRIDGGGLPPAVERFLNEKWATVMTLAHSVEDDKPGMVQFAGRAMDDLIWSVRPKATHEQRKQLISSLPGLLKRLNKWLDAIKWTDEGRPRFLAELAQVHAAIVRAPIDNSPERQLELATAAAQEEAVRRVRLEQAAEAAEEAGHAEPGAQAAEALPKGAVLDFIQADGSRRRARLSWISPRHTLYVFATNGRQESFSLTAEKLAALLSSGKAERMEEAGLVGRALSEALAGAAPPSP